MTRVKAQPTPDRNLDELTIEGLARTLSRGPVRVLLATVGLGSAVDMLDELEVTRGLRVARRWRAHGLDRLLLESGAEVRATSFQGMRGESAELVVLSATAACIPEFVASARAVIATHPTGRVVFARTRHEREATS